MTIEDQLKEIKRGAVDILTEDELVRKLRKNKPLNIKFGVDPTAPDIHLGHTVPLQKLKRFQDLGHNVQLIIGDYTAMIGDPSGRSETRPILSREEIVRNMETYKKQVFKVLDQDKTDLFYNSKWLGQFSGTDMIKLSSKYTIQQLLQRRDFGERIKQNRPLSLTELLYPLLVGYDSVHLNSDIELGGTDQLFNFMTSREIQKAYGQEPEVVITLPLLEGIDGIKKMSKSIGNSIGVNDDPGEMYGKIMSISDNLMLKYYELLSETTLEELQEIKSAIISGSINPMEYKQKLARELISRYNSQDSAAYAEEKFNRIHRQKIAPEKLEEKVIAYSAEQDLCIIKIIKEIGKAKSNSEARRLIEQGGVRIDGSTITDIRYILSPKVGQIIQVGKRYFVKLGYKRV